MDDEKYIKLLKALGMLPEEDTPNADGYDTIEWTGVVDTTPPPEEPKDNVVDLKEYREKKKK